MTTFPITRRAAAFGLGSALGAAALGVAPPAPGADESRPRDSDAQQSRSGTRPMKIIGLEEHFATPEFMAAWNKVPIDEREPSIELVEAAGYDKYLYFCGRTLRHYGRYGNRRARPVAEHTRYSMLRL